MDITGPAPFGAQAALAAQLPVRPPPDTSRIDAAGGTGRPGADPRNTPGQGDPAGAARDLSAHRPARIDPDLPAGPPPSFQVSLLEVENDLQQVIARIEAARGQLRDADGVRGLDPVSQPATDPARETGATDSAAQTAVLAATPDPAPPYDPTAPAPVAVTAPGDG